MVGSSTAMSAVAGGSGRGRIVVDSGVGRRVDAGEDEGWGGIPPEITRPILPSSSRLAPLVPPGPFSSQVELSPTPTPPPLPGRLHSFSRLSPLPVLPGADQRLVERLGSYQALLGGAQYRFGTTGSVQGPSAERRTPRRSATPSTSIVVRRPPLTPRPRISPVADSSEVDDRSPATDGSADELKVEETEVPMGVMKEGEARVSALSVRTI